MPHSLKFVFGFELPGAFCCTRRSRHCVGAPLQLWGAGLSLGHGFLLVAWISPWGAGPSLGPGSLLGARVSPWGLGPSLGRGSLLGVRVPPWGADFSLGCLLSLQTIGSWGTAFSSWGPWASSLRGMWNLHGPGFEPMFPALAGRFLTTGTPGKSVLNL